MDGHDATTAPAVTGGGVIPPFFLSEYTHNDMRLVYWDIESLGNIFEVGAWEPGRGRIDIWYLIDAGWDSAAMFDGSGLQPDLGGRMDPRDPSSPLVMDVLVDRILKCNPALTDWDITGDDIVTHDLHTADGLLSLGTFIGISDAQGPFDKSLPSTFPDAMRPRTFLDMDFDPVGRDFYRIGFNSSSYDLTMVAILYYEAGTRVAAMYGDGSGDGDGRTVLQVPDAEVMRRYNDTLFNSWDGDMSRYLWTRRTRWKDGLVPSDVKDPYNFMPNRIYRNALASGLHVDAMNLNERSHVGLKRLLGMKGLQILESSKLGTADNMLDSMDAVCDMIAYNISDIVGTGQLFEDDVYGAQFDLKLGLMRTYPQTVLDEDGLALVRRVRGDETEKEES